MIQKLKTSNEEVRHFFRNKFSKIIEINNKYAHPKIEMSTTVKVSLFMLRVYLIFLLLLLVFKFITVIN